MLKSRLTKINILFLGMLFCHLVVPYFLAFFLKDITYYTVLLLAQLLLQFPVVIYLAVTETNPLKLISFRLIHPGAALLVILMTYCVLPLTSLANMISMLFVENALTDVSEVIIQNNFWLNLLFIAVVPALSEEFAFRGVIFHTLKKHGKWFAVVCSALFFGMMHLNFNQFSYTFVIGMVMALAVLATGSIWGSVLVHLTLNANSVILMKVFEQLSRMLPDVQDSAAEILEQGGEAALSASDILPAIVLIAVVAAVMLIPAGCFLYAIAHICKQKDVIGPMFFPKKYAAGMEMPCPLSGNASCRAEAAEPEKQGEDIRQNRILDVFFIICLLVSFGYMIYIAAA